MKQTDFWILIAKYLKNTLNKEEEAELNNLTHASTDKKILFDEANVIWENAVYEDKIQLPDKEKAWGKIEGLIRENERSIFTRVRFIRQISIAASIIVLLGLGFLFLTKDEIPVYTEMRIFSADSVKEIMLPDGTAITLNQNSELKYNSPFNSVRLVSLTGEAFFKVAKDSTKPFIVQLKNSQVKVLGTSFNIKTFPDDSMVVVSVKTGKVKLSLNGVQKKSEILSANEECTLVNSKQTLTKKSIENENYAVWFTGRIQFNSTRLIDIINLLNDQFSPHIIIQDKELEDIIVTISFKNQTVTQMLDVIEQIADIQYMYKNDTIKILKK